MKRPGLNLKGNWLSMAGVLFLMLALVMGVASNAKAATGSFDSDPYLPSLNDTNDFDRAWLSVTDTSITTSTTDEITVTVKAGSNSISYVLLETGATSTVFTTTGSTQPTQTGVGTTSGYVGDFAGSYLYPALGTGVSALQLHNFVTQTGGNASSGTSGKLNVSAGSTLELLYSGSTLDTAVIGFHGASDSISFTQGPAWGETADSPNSAAANIIISITDPDANLNPLMKDCIGLQDGFTSGITGTGSSRVQVEAIDQSTGLALTVDSTSVKSTHIVLTETGNSTGVFTANGKVYGSTTAGQLHGNLAITGTQSADNRRYLGSGTARVSGNTNYTYDGGLVALGDVTIDEAGAVTVGDGPGVSFKILEITNSGRIALVDAGPMSSGFVGNGAFGTVTLAYDANSTAASANFDSGWGTSSLSSSKVVAVGTNTTLFGDGNSSGHFGTNTSGIIKLIDGTDYCLVQISRWKGTDTAGDSTTNTYETLQAGGSVTVSIDSFLMSGIRDGDSIKVSYLDPLTTSGTVGTVTGTLAFGLTGETGVVSVSATTVDINDFLTVTVVDGNLNTSSNTKESVASGSWLGTTTAERGDRLTVKAYSSDSDGVSNKISLSFPDGTSIGSQTSAVRISNTGNTLVWVLPTNATVVGSGVARGTAGSVTFSLGTQTVDTNTLVKGSSNDAKSFLGSANTSSFVATLDGLGNTVEVSPDGTRWIAVPVTETGVNSSTFVGTIGFDWTAVRITTNTAKTTAQTFSDFTGTSTIDFHDTPTLTSVIGTGSVVRIADDGFSEFAEVTSVSATKLTVTKLSNSLFYTPWKTFVGVVGNDMDTTRIESNVFYIGGYHKGTYRVRYNDQLNNDGAYASGSTLATTADNVLLQTYDGSLSVSPSGTVGLNSEIVVTVVDEDLNTSTADKQSTMKDTAALWAGNVNEVGLGRPGSGTANSNDNVVTLKGTIAKQLLVSRATTGVGTTDFNSSTNTIDVLLTETGNNTGTFKGTFKLSAGSSTDNNGADNNGLNPILNVSNGHTVTIYYNDSPSSTNENNLISYTTVALSAQGGVGTLETDKVEAFLSGDSVIVTLIDNDLNTTSAKDTGSVKLRSSSDSSDVTGGLTLTENETSSGTFIGTFQTGATSAGGTIPTVRAVAGGNITVTYSDASPAADITTVVDTKNFGAVLEVTDAVPLEGNAVVSLYDPETNTSISTANVVNVNVVSSTDSTGTTLRLTETGNNTGSFLGTMAVSASNTLVNTRIKAATGDTVTVSFTDNPDEDGSISVVTDTATVGEVATPTPTPTGSVTPTTTPTASPTPTVSPIPGTGSVEGFVTDAATGDGIEGATVRNQSGIYTDTTDADGFYSIANVEAGTRTFTAVALGYVPSAPTAIVVTAGGTTNLDFALVASVQGTPTTTPTVTPPPTATLVVVVSDVDGPLAGATVTVDGQSGITDASGGATFTLEAGDYEVSVSATDHITSNTTVTVTPPVTIHEVTLDIKSCGEPGEVEASNAKVTPDILDLVKGDSEDVIVLVTGDNECPAQGVKVKRKLTSANKKKIKVTPASQKTDRTGQATFTVKAKKNKGKANVKFGVKGVKVTPKVNVSLSK
ncbi:MAG: carboxypeptidase regulatory-like domain-containing protein [Candidatus Kuenenia sp.]|uniref:Kustd1514 family S-layer glycoprotein n=1 Tax=Candidatus Kuenenia sp. TaxID=2499824 RepID=UPI0022CCD179|nr:carboxypeptidase-like regulatory domain-containing protein [Candidatus Kuenenia sp.]MCZ7624221.1 carboxypeptidase regulatory-like domain-containing protein [Candidatus Kuenenia sp.]